MLFSNTDQSDHQVNQQVGTTQAADLQGQQQTSVPGVMPTDGMQSGVASKAVVQRVSGQQVPANDKELPQNPTRLHPSAPSLSGDAYSTDVQRPSPQRSAAQQIQMGAPVMGEQQRGASQESSNQNEPLDIWEAATSPTTSQPEQQQTDAATPPSRQQVTQQQDRTVPVSGTGATIRIPAAQPEVPSSTPGDVHAQHVPQQQEVTLADDPWQVAGEALQQQNAGSRAPVAPPQAPFVDTSAPSAPTPDPAPTPVATTPNEAAAPDAPDTPSTQSVRPVAAAPASAAEKGEDPGQVSVDTSTAVEMPDVAPEEALSTLSDTERAQNKAADVLAVLRGYETKASVAEKHQISIEEVLAWMDLVEQKLHLLFLDTDKADLSQGGKDSAALQHQMDVLHQLLGTKDEEIAMLKEQLRNVQASR